MSKQTAIIIASVVGVGAISYGLYIYIKNKNPKEKPDVPPSQPIPASNSAAASNTSGSYANSYPPTPFTNKSDGDDFRQWVNLNYPDYAKSIQLDASGEYNNSYIRKAYAQYGNEYQSQLQWAATAFNNTAPTGDSYAPSAGVPYTNFVTTHDVLYSNLLY